MPELPDVEAARCYLIASGLVGSTVTGVDVLWPRAVYRITADAFARGVSSQTVVELARRAKYLLFRLAPSTTKRAPKSPETSRTTLIVHLGMTGGLLLAPSSQPRPRFCTAVFTLDRAREIRFTDPRKLGHLWLVSDETEVTGKLGPEPLEPEFTPRVLAGIVAGKATPIKALLLDQAAIAGIGNIYADEALFAARIAPTKQAAALTSAEVNRLHRA
ncbi:MAG: formamidopyrimidine-DNA glycosylase, partial [SAR202 cluster bacterium]|nr:formamidopyrimidine-DNA glycosylase [SAR202 cluster bacterium]